MRPVSACSTCGHTIQGANARNGRVLKNLYWVSTQDESEKHPDGSKHKPDESSGAGARARSDYLGFNDRRRF